MALRFLLQSDVVVIPKSVHKERMQQNFDVFDFTLSAEDTAAIDALYFLILFSILTLFPVPAAAVLFLPLNILRHSVPLHRLSK